ncbi:PadR family transcriptional regulator [Anaerosporobacter faecicola]|uniref:PadR family transcriptional regulator n=1 Tax=Anaerosporobacter faecicola TaxID=2718714 RepID=UPI00143C47D3|nr:PadR family transcriptional regulator [Anaerosporobacter faecicola]
MAKSNEPLTESYFYILLCLFNGPNHGYAIMQETASLTGERVKIGAGTMYGAITNLLKKNYIIEYSGEGNEDRRKLYELTDLGREVLQGEVHRLNQLVHNAMEVMNEKEDKEE